MSEDFVSGGKLTFLSLVFANFIAEFTTLTLFDIDSITVRMLSCVERDIDIALPSVCSSIRPSARNSRHTAPLCCQIG